MPTKSGSMVQFLPEPVQYHPGQTHDKETARRIRAHIAENRRRKKIQILTSPQRVREETSSRDFCACIVTNPSTPVVIKGNTESKALQKQRVIADGYKICQQCHKLQFTELSWSGQLKAARARIPAVSTLLEAEFDPFQSLPELSHFKQSTITHREFNELKAHLVAFYSYNIIRTDVLPVAAKEPSLFMSLLYCSCAYLNAMRGCGETPLSMAIKAEAMRQINVRLQRHGGPENDNISVTIASISFLSSGVYVFGSPNVLQETEAHEDGSMILFNQSLSRPIEELDPVGQALWKSFLLHRFSRSATLGLAMDEGWVDMFCPSSQIISHTDFLPESPLYCPRGDFYIVCKSSKCNNHTLRILYSVRLIVDWILENHIGFDYEATRDILLGMPSASVSSDLQVKGDYIYESCRLATLLMIQAIDFQTSFVNLEGPLISQLKNSLQKTDIGNYWGAMSGVLYWIAMVGAATAIGKPEHPFLTSVVARGDYELTYGKTVFEGATIAAYNFQRLHMCLRLGIGRG